MIGEFSVLRKLGKNWNKIAKEIPTKTAAQVKHYFHNHRKRLALDDCFKNPSLIHVQKLSLSVKLVSLSLTSVDWNSQSVLLAVLIITYYLTFISESKESRADQV